MRIFIAIKLSEELREKVAHLRKQYGDLPVRWNRPDGLHVTLVPPWEMEESELPSLIERLKALDVVSFDLFFDRLKMPIADIIKSNRESDMFWLYGPASKPFLVLKDELEHILGLEVARSEFQNHVTLARFRRKDVSSSPVKRIDEQVNWRQPVRSIVLLRSRPDPAGAIYETLAEFPLKEKTER